MELQIINPAIRLLMLAITLVQHCDFQHWYLSMVLHCTGLGVRVSALSVNARKLVPKAGHYLLNVCICKHINFFFPSAEIGINSTQEGLRNIN